MDFRGFDPKRPWSHWLKTCKNVVGTTSAKGLRDWGAPSLTLNLLTTTIVAPPSNASKWQMGFNSAFKRLSMTAFLLQLRKITKKTVRVIARAAWAGPPSDSQICGCYHLCQHKFTFVTTAPNKQTSSTYFGTAAPLPFPLGFATAHSDVTAALVQFSARTRSRHCVRNRRCRHRVNIRSFTALCKPATNIPGKAFVIKTTLVQHTQKYKVLQPKSSYLTGGWYLELWRTATWS